MADTTIQKFTLFQLTGANAYAAMLTSQAAAATSATNAATSATNAATSATAAAASATAAAASAASAASAATTAVNAAVSGTANKIAKFTGTNAVGDSSISDDGSSVTGTLPLLQPAGTAALPSLSFSGDPNTGIYRIGADTLGISTGGTLRVTIASTGAITITSATANPILTLDATGTQDNALQWFRSGAVNAAIYQENAGGLNIRNFTAQPMTFWTNSIERMRIDSSGNVGIGMTPSSFVDIGKNQNATTILRVVNTDTGASGAAQLRLDSGTSKYVHLYVNGNGNYLTFAGVNGIVTQYNDFDTHYFRTNAGSNKVIVNSTGVMDLNQSTGRLQIAGTQVVGPRDTGWAAMTGTSNKNTTYDTLTVTLAQLAGRVMSMQTALTNHGLLGA